MSLIHAIAAILGWASGLFFALAIVFGCMYAGSSRWDSPTKQLGWIALAVATVAFLAAIVLHFLGLVR